MAKKRVWASVINLMIAPISQSLEEDNPTELISVLSRWQLSLSQKW